MARCRCKAQSAHRRNPRADIQQRQDRIEHRAPDVFKIDVDSLRTGGCEARRQARTVMINAGIEAQFCGDETAFFCAASDADDLATEDPGDLTDDRAQPACRDASTPDTVPPTMTSPMRSADADEGASGSRPRM